MLNKKYDYKKLKRVNIDGKRHYVLNGVKSSPAPSVTTILSATKDQDDVEALNRWRKNIGWGRANAITNEAANRGTRMHKYLERYITDNEFPTPGSNPYAIQANLMAACIESYGFKLVDEVWGTEVSLLFPDIYGGSTDCVGLHDGDEAIIDFKQTNKLKKLKWIDDYFLQTVFYGVAHNEMYGTNIRKGVIMMCSKDWQYQEFTIEGNTWDKMEQVMWRRTEQYYELL